MRRVLWMCGVGIALSIAVYFLFRTEKSIWQYLLVPYYVVSTLSGTAMHTDIAQDFYGFQAMVYHTDPYPKLATIYQSIGYAWDLQLASTHPPTAFLLTAPVAMLPWRWASAIWAWAMLAAVVVSFHAYDLSWKNAFLFTAVSLLWPPVSNSLGQLTPLWLLGIALAYQHRNNRPFLAGIWLGFASLAKFLPGVFLILFIVRKKWSAVFGFGAVWVVAVLILAVISPNSISRYMEVNRLEGLATILRLDNAAFITSTLARFGWFLAGIAAALVIVVALANWRDWVLKKEITRRSWMLFSYLAVILLPIAWVYSLLPLLPDIFHRLNLPHRSSYLAFTAAAAVTMMPLYSVETYYYVAVFFVLYGLSFFFDWGQPKGAEIQV